MATWRELLQPASFRGVPFFVDGAQNPAGRRTQVHEFVQRDLPDVEDLGKAIGPIKITAFVIGADCFERRDALLAALEKPGSGELVHPWIGKMTVTAGECSFSHDRKEGGLVRFDLQFVEVGAERGGFPSGVPNTARQLDAASDSLLDAALGRFNDSMGLLDSARLQSSALRDGVAQAFGMVGIELPTLVKAVGNLDGLVDMLMSTPTSLSELVGGALSGLLPGFLGYGSSLRRLSSRAASVRSLSAPSTAGGSGTATATQATQALLRDAVLVQAAREAAAIPVPSSPALPVSPSLEQQLADPVTRDAPPAAADVVGVRDALGDALWSASLTADPEHFRRLEDVRRLQHRHLTAVAAGGVQLVTVTPAAEVPALVLAYRHFGDASRTPEIVSRNRIRHPGFLPPAALQVAQE